MLGKFTRKDFLDAVFSQYYRDQRGFVLVKTVKREDEKIATRYFPNVEVLNKEIYGDDRDVYFGVCPRERMRPEKEHVKYVLALWADINIGSEGHQKGEPAFPGPEEAARAMRDFPRPPSITVDSGHGLHLYWLLEKPTEVSNPSEIESLLKQLQARLNCMENPDLDALMRLPDTFNNKVYGQPQRCNTKFINSNFRYSLQDLDISTKAFPSVGLPITDSKAPEPLQSLDHSTEASTGIVELHYAERATDTAQGQTSKGPLDFGAYETSPFEGRDQLDVPLPELVSDAPGELQRLIAGGKSVELALVGTDRILLGKIEWVEKGWIGIREGEHQYAIPISNILFVRHQG
jgi:hypothetical protein